LRYFIDLAYNGTNYHGWQIQPNAISVQETLTKVLTVLLKENIGCMGAGRTDTGVHATQMIAHFDVSAPIDTEDIKFKLNSFLPKDIAIQAIKPVKPDAHARFDAIQRTYSYTISRKKNPFGSETVHQFTLPLDVDLMNEAAKILFDYNDFECFSRSNSDVKTFLCNIIHAQWTQKGSVLEFKITADRFLRNMVRAIVGTMINIGTKKISLDDFHAIIQSKDRSQAGASAPAKGLYLTKIQYPNSIYIGK
jgi:tRNA pseudouridine38-40 synthase